MRTLSVSLVVVSLLTGCAQTLSDSASGYPGFPASPSAASEPSPGSRHVPTEATTRDALDAPAAPAPRAFEPKLGLREIAPREPPHRTDFVECWQCRR